MQSKLAAEVGPSEVVERPSMPGIYLARAPRPTCTEAGTITFDAVLLRDGVARKVGGEVLIAQDMVLTVVANV